jgi:ABC-type branched-subunit amino acid transport system permease subunit
MTPGATRFLLPHERLVVGWMLASQRTHKTAAVVGLEQKYGPQGIIWMNAYFADLLFLLIPAAGGFIAIFSDPTGTSRIALYMLAAVCLFLVLAAVRVLQASHAGRKYRRDRR